MERIEEDDITGNLQMKVNGIYKRNITAYFIQNVMLYSRARMRAWIMFNIT